MTGIGEEAGLLVPRPAEACFVINHIGSTAVDGIWAKTDY